MAGEIIGHDGLDGVLLGPGDVHAVGMHPAGHAAEGVVPSKVEHPAQVLPCYELSGGAEEVGPDDAAAVIVLLEGPGAGTPGAHAYCPAHHLVLLRLHGPHPRHNIVGRGELRTDELLVQQALGDGVHIKGNTPYSLVYI